MNGETAPNALMDMLSELDVPSASPDDIKWVANVCKITTTAPLSVSIDGAHKVLSGVDPQYKADVKTESKKLDMEFDRTLALRYVSKRSRSSPLAFLARSVGFLATLFLGVVLALVAMHLDDIKAHVPALPGYPFGGRTG